MKIPKKVMVVGGTGTLGQALIEHYSENHYTKIICYSRDELKQHEMRKKYPNVHYIVGDIRNEIGSFETIFENIDILYHVAALKHIDVLEKNIVQALKTNVTGTINVADFAIAHNIPTVAFSSTDKAVNPINVYGYTKALSEKYLQYLNTVQDKTNFRIFRWGNVLGSRGSAIHLFRESLKKERKIYLTDVDMTRFWIKIEDAVKFMVNISERENSEDGSINIPSMKAARVLDLALTVAEQSGVKLTFDDIKIIGVREGEKIHEDIKPDQNSNDAEWYSAAELRCLVEDVA